MHLAELLPRLAGKRLDSIGVENTQENRRAYRTLLLSAPGASQHLGIDIRSQAEKLGDATFTQLLGLDHAGRQPQMSVRWSTLPACHLPA